MPDLKPFTIDVSEAVLDDLRYRLSHVRWPDDIANDDWRYGANVEYLKELVDYWLKVYDWRAQERKMNAYAHFQCEIEGMPVHFIHEKGRGPSPVPIILNHGWPWTFWYYNKIIGPLTDPASHGGDPADCFDVIVPSLPGFGFSSPLTRPGIDFRTTARMWVTLMRDLLGYERFAAGGGDWGAFVSSQIGHEFPECLYGVHLSLAIPIDYFPNGAPGPQDYAPHEATALRQTQASAPHVIVHNVVNTREPQTIACAMNDSPFGMAAWLIMRLRLWSDCEGDVERRFSKDEIITTLMIYWITQTFGSAARFYYEAAQKPWEPSRPIYPIVSAPTALALFPRDMLIPPRKWAERYYNLARWTEMDSGGHFAPMEEPAALIDDIRAFFRPMRG